MPKPVKGKRLGGSAAHQKLMLSNLATALFEHGRITTTETRARLLRPHAEKLITKAKRGDLHNRREVLKTIRDKSVVHTLFTEIAPVMAERPGGYTRITKVGPRKGDNAPMAVIELVTEAYSPKAPSTKKTEKAAAPAPAAPVEAEETEDADADDRRCRRSTRPPLRSTRPLPRSTRLPLRSTRPLPRSTRLLPRLPSGATTPRPDPGLHTRPVTPLGWRASLRVRRAAERWSSHTSGRSSVAPSPLAGVSYDGARGSGGPATFAGPGMRLRHRSRRSEGGEDLGGVEAAGSAPGAGQRAGGGDDGLVDRGADAVEAALQDHLAGEVVDLRVARAARQALPGGARRGARGRGGAGGSCRGAPGPPRR